MPSAKACTCGKRFDELQRVATQLVAEDPYLQAVPDLLQLLEGCAAVGLQHRGLLEATASALTLQMENKEYALP